MLKKLKNNLNALVYLYMRVLNFSKLDASEDFDQIKLD